MRLNRPTRNIPDPQAGSRNRLSSSEGSPSSCIEDKFSQESWSVKRSDRLLFLFATCLEKVLIDRTYCLNRNNAKVIGPERQLPGLHIGGPEKAVEDADVLVLNLLRFIEGVVEEITVKVSAELLEKGIEFLLGIGPPEMSRK